jgi:two-component system, OmpR family, response regulator
MRILVVEDEAALASRIRAALVAAGFVAEVVLDGEEAVSFGEVEPFDAAVLDLGLPKLDGLSVLRRWRDLGVRMPVLVLTARERWSDKLAGFDAGADDYVTKPFEMDEVVVRVRALVRRAAGHASPVLECGPLRMDTSNGRTSIGGQAVELTAHELRILEYLLHHAGRTVTRLDLFDHVYERDADRDSNVLDVLVGRIRRKIGAGMIRTVRGRGYRLEAPQG